jgi:peptide/nickel transport system substrate-binding protein
MDLALRQLEAQSDWRAAREQLLLIHRMAHDSVPLVPLWQLTDHFAHRRNLTGLGDAPVQLYQNVQQWRSPLMLPPDVN